MKKKRVVVKCKECKKQESVFPSRAKKYVCCSVECLGKYNSKRYSKKIEKKCEYCGKTFLIKPSHEKRRKCCSMECQDKIRPIRTKGSGNANYKGRVLDSDGYLLDEKTREKKHRKICREIFEVDKLPSNCDVHHIDCNKLNNSPKNLVLLSKSSHRWLHKHFGNAVLKALANKKISIETLISWSDNKEKAKRLLNLTCIEQSVVLKRGELLENLI